jgi:distribution and morphology protein 31
MLQIKVVQGSLATSHIGNLSFRVIARLPRNAVITSLPSTESIILRLRNLPFGLNSYALKGENGLANIQPTSLYIPAVSASSAPTISSSRAKKTIKYNKRQIPTFPMRSSKRSYCSSVPKENPSSAPKTNSKPDETPVNNLHVASQAEQDHHTPPTQEHYGTLLWRRLKSLPYGLKRFVGLHGPMTLDKLLPFFNLMFVGAGLGILVGTTSVVSLGIWVVNRNDHWKELTAKKLSAYLTYQTGISIEYESMSASWRDRRITLKNVKIVRDPFSFAEGESRNVTAMNLHVHHMTVSVSLMWLLQGNGLLKHLAADGVTGFVDQRHLDWAGWTPTKRIWKRGDFFLDAFQLSNANISLFMFAPARELKIQIHSVDCEKLRKQWLLRDILSASSAYGIFDGSLFSLTRLPKTSSDEDRVRSSLKIDGVNADLISTSSSGPISWITEGTIDIDMDLEFRDEYWEEGWHYHLDTNTQNGFYSHDSLYEVDPLLLDIRLKLNNLRADIPMSTDQLTLINKALVIPVVAYMNTNYTCIPLAFPVHVAKDQFDGAWSPWEAGLFEAISAGCAQQFLSLVKEQQTSTNIQRHLLMVIKSFHRGLYFLRQQVQSYYSLWYFNNDEHPEDMYAL